MIRWVVLFILLSCFSQAAINYKTVASAGETTFVAKGYPSAIQIKGQSPTPSGRLEVVIDTKKAQVKGLFNLDLTTLDTGIGLRDRHMKEKYLETGKFQTATLKIDPIDFQGVVKSGKGPFKGTLNLHGEEKPVSGEYELVVADEKKWTVKAHFVMKLTDFKIDVPKFSGITVADEVAVNVETQLEKAVE